MLHAFKSKEEKENEKFFLELYEKYNKLVYSLAFRESHNNDLSEECVQDTFLNVFQKIEIFKTLDENHRRNLICTIARGKVIDYLRKASHDVSFIGDAGCEAISDFEDINADSFENYDIESILDAIKTLNEKEQTLIFLKYSYGFSNVEIGKMYGISASYVGRVLKKSLEKIKTNLEGK